MDTSSLHSAASTIRTETQESANTAERVGSCLDSIVTAIDELSTTYANSTQAGLMTSATYNTLSTQVTRIDEINERLTHLSDRYFATANCESIDELNNRLNAIKESNNQGLYVIPVFGIPLLATIACNKEDQSVWVQTLSGCVLLTDDAQKIKDAGSYLSYVQLVRYYNKNGGKSGWAAWEKGVPTPQTTPDGNSKQYIYSDSTTKNHSVLCGDFKAFQNSGQCLLRFAIWGGDTSTSGKYITREIPVANTSSNGLFDKESLKRLRNTTLTESADTTTTEVKITYPDYANGATKTLTLTTATSAKAGILTTATYNTIMTSVQRLDDYREQIKALEARVAALEAKA